MCAQYMNIYVKILYMESFVTMSRIEIGQGRSKNCQGKRVKIPKSSRILFAFCWRIPNNLPSKFNKLYYPAARERIKRPTIDSTFLVKKFQLLWFGTRKIRRAGLSFNPVTRIKLIQREEKERHVGKGKRSARLREKERGREKSFLPGTVKFSRCDPYVLSIVSPRLTTHWSFRFRGSAPIVRVPPLGNPKKRKAWQRP